MKTGDHVLEGVGPPLSGTGSYQWLRLQSYQYLAWRRSLTAYGIPAEGQGAIFTRKSVNSFKEVVDGDGECSLECCSQIWFWSSDSGGLGRRDNIVVMLIKPLDDATYCMLWFWGMCHPGRRRPTQQERNALKWDEGVCSESLSID